eukprot:jgi/Mesvir1/12043/Mv00329-RA.1
MMMTMILIDIAGLGPHRVAAATTQRVATERQFRDAVANRTIDTIDVTSSFALTESVGIFIDRSLSIAGSCDAPPNGKGCCTIGVGGKGPAQALHVQATAPDMYLAIKGICFSATDVLTDAEQESGAFTIEGTGCAVTCTNCGFFNNRAVSCAAE